MSEATRAVVIAGVVGALILIGPIALLAAGVVNPGTMVLIQLGLLGAIYLAALAIKARRERENDR